MTSAAYRGAVPARVLIDLALAVFLVLMWVTGDVTLWLHLAYICIPVRAYILPGAAATAARAGIVSLAAGLVLARLHGQGHLSSDEFLEIPLLALLAFSFAGFSARRARAEADISRDRARVTGILDQIPLATVAFDAHGRVVSWNASAERAFGWRAEEVIGLPNPIVPPGEREASDELFQELLRGRPMHGVEVSRCTRDGTPLDLALFSAPLHASSGVLILYADISERHRAQVERDGALRRYQELIEALPLVTYIDRVDGDATNVYTSPQIADLLGCPANDWADDSQLFADLLHPDDVERVMAKVHESNETHIPFEDEYRLRHRDGHYVWVRDHSSIVDSEGSEGSELYARGFLLDITEQKRLETQLLQSQKMDALGQFAGGIAHDFNNLLTGIGGYADLATPSAAGNPVLTRCLNGIKTATNEAASLTARLLTFSRRDVPGRTQVATGDVVASAAEFLERLVRADIRIVVRLGEDVPPVEGDPAQLKQVVLNLALNARDAMHDGGTLTLETDRLGEDAVIRVRDTGEGMDAATLDRALEPFFTTKPEGEGTGLGLAVVYGVVDALGGSIRLESTPGKGTLAEIVLPGASAPAVLGVPGPAPGALRSATARILLTEDREVVRMLTQEVLQNAGFDVSVAVGGREAVELAASLEPFDLLLTDVVMPGMSGPELAARLRGTRPGQKVLYMSGYTDDVLDPSELERDGTAFLRKPFQNTELISAVVDALGYPWAAPAFASASSVSSASTG